MARPHIVRAVSWSTPRRPGQAHGKIGGGDCTLLRLMIAKLLNIACLQRGKIKLAFRVLRLWILVDAPPPTYACSVDFFAVEAGQ